MLSKEVRDVACGAIALLASHLPGLAAPVQVTDACIEAAKKATVDAAFKVEARERPTQQTQKEQQASQADTQSPPVRLGDVIAVKVSSLENLKKECQNVPIILYLNGYPIRTVRPYPPSSPGELRFVLRVTD